MRVERALVGLLCVIAAALSGCGGQLAYNLPPASRLMEPGPGVGGPGPGVIPPAGNPYGIYGGAVGRYGDGMGGYMGGSYEGGCPPYAANQAAAPENSSVPKADYGAVQQAQFADGYDSDYAYDGACGCGDTVGTGGHCADGGCACGCGDGGCVDGCSGCG